MERRREYAQQRIPRDADRIVESGKTVAYRLPFVLSQYAKRFRRVAKEVARRNLTNSWQIARNESAKHNATRYKWAASFISGRVVADIEPPYWRPLPLVEEPFSARLSANFVGRNERKATAKRVERLASKRSLSAPRRVIWVAGANVNRAQFHSVPPLRIKTLRQARPNRLGHKTPYRQYRIFRR